MIRVFLIFLSFFFSNSLWAFPENVRHGYFNCTACHVSPSGGGVLTPYGRSLSAEVMSTWGTAKQSGMFFTDNEEESQNPPWFRSQLMLRGVQTRRNTPSVDKAQFIPMQADYEFGVDQEKYALIASIGYRSSNPSISKDLNQFFSRKHFGLYRANDNLTIRAGKFMFSFGLNGPDHITATRRGLGWDQGSESYNLEASYLTEKSSSIFTLLTDSPSENSVTKDKGFAVNQSFLLKEDSKVGISGFQGGQTLYERTVIGPYWIYAFSKNMYLDSELFYQQKRIKASSNSQSGYATFHRLGYEYRKGLILFAQFDRSFLDTSDETSKYDNYGPGIQWLPYPHFEMTGYLGKEKAYAQSANDFWWLMIYIYL